MKSSLLLSVLMIVIFTYLNRAFDGVVAAKLPFEPISLIQGISHRGIEGEDYYECNVMFLYILVSMGVRASIQKYCGFLPPKGSQSIWQPLEQLEEKQE